MRCGACGARSLDGSLGRRRGSARVHYRGPARSWLTTVRSSWAGRGSSQTRARTTNTSGGQAGHLRQKRGPVSEKLPHVARREAPAVSGNGYGHHRFASFGAPLPFIGGESFAKPGRFPVAVMLSLVVFGALPLRCLSAVTHPLAPCLPLTGRPDREASRVGRLVSGASPHPDAARSAHRRDLPARGR